MIHHRNMMVFICRRTLLLVTVDLLGPELWDHAKGVSMKIAATACTRRKGKASKYSISKNGGQG